MCDPPESVGDRIRKHREAHGWSQNELARRAMVTRSSITRLEAGERFHISLESSRKIAEALGVSVDYLARGDEESSTSLMPAGVGFSGKVSYTGRDDRPLW